MNNQNKKVMAVGLMFACPYHKNDVCPLLPYKEEFLEDPKSMIKQFDEEIIDLVISTHIKCKHCQDKDLFSQPPPEKNLK